MNAFDFHYITITSTRKNDLLKGGVRPDQIHTTTIWQNYGAFGYPRRFPRTRYEATVEFFDVQGAEGRTRTPDDAAAEWRSKCPTATVSIKYHCAD